VREHVQIRRIEKLDHVDVRPVRLRLVREMQAEGIVIKTRDEIAKLPRRLPMHDFAVRHTCRDHTYFVRQQLKALPRKPKIRAPLQLEKNLRPIAVVVHPPQLVIRLHLLRHAQFQVIALGQLDRTVKGLPHLRTVLVREWFGGEEGLGRLVGGGGGHTTSIPEGLVVVLG